MRERFATLSVLLILAACGSTTSSNETTATTIPVTTVPVTTMPVTTVPVTTVPVTTVPVTTVPVTTVPVTTVPVTTVPVTTVPCTASGDTAPKQSTDPLLMSSLVGKDIRTGGHACFERVVIELQGTGDFPGWAAQYVDDPVTLGESDEKAYIAGTATLLVRMGMWMQTMEGVGYDGPWDIFPTNVVHIEELRMTENWEGMTIWAIGLDQQRAFSVAVLSGPPRLVIDIQTGT